MFEDFDKSKATTEGRGRMGVSFLISGGLFVGIAAALAAAIATARVVVRRQQRDVPVAFASLPRAPKPKPVIRAQPGRPKAAPRRSAPRAPCPSSARRRPRASWPTPARSARSRGFAAGEGGGGGGAVKALPQQVNETIEEPKFLSGCRAPEIPDALTATAATIEIDVRMMIDVRGLVRTAEVLRPHPLVPNDLILQCARAQVFRPAHLPDGTPVPYPYRRRFVFLPARV